MLERSPAGAGRSLERRIRGRAGLAERWGPCCDGEAPSKRGALLVAAPLWKAPSGRDSYPQTPCKRESPLLGAFLLLLLPPSFIASLRRRESSLIFRAPSKYGPSSQGFIVHDEGKSDFWHPRKPLHFGSKIHEVAKKRRFAWASWRIFLAGNRLSRQYARKMCELASENPHKPPLFGCCGISLAKRKGFACGPALNVRGSILLSAG